MKKLLGIVVLGLLWCSVGFAEIITLKCVTFKMEIMGKDKNPWGETYVSKDSDLFMKLDTNDKNAIKSDLKYEWYRTDGYITYESINRYDLTKFSKSIQVDKTTMNDYKSLWDSRKNDPDALNKFYQNLSKQYYKINLGKKTEDFTMSQTHKCEIIEKKF